MQNYADEADGVYTYSTPASMIEAAKPSKKGRLYEVDDLVPGIINEDLGKQLFSPDILPKGNKVWSDTYFGVPFGDKRITFDYSNANPNQKVIVKEKQVGNYTPIYINDKNDPRINQYTEAGRQYLYKKPDEKVVIENNYTAKVGDRWYDPTTKAYEKALANEKQNKEVKKPTNKPVIEDENDIKAKKPIVKKDEYGDDKSMKMWEVDVVDVINGKKQPKRTIKIHSRKDLDRIIAKQKNDKTTFTGSNNTIKVRPIKRFANGGSL